MREQNDELRISIPSLCTAAQCDFCVRYYVNGLSKPCVLQIDYKTAFLNITLDLDRSEKEYMIKIKIYCIKNERQRPKCIFKLEFNDLFNYK